MTDTIEIKPTTNGYARMLMTLVREGSQLQDREWAQQELLKLVAKLDRERESLCDRVEGAYAEGFEDGLNEEHGASWSAAWDASISKDTLKRLLDA